MMKMPNSYGLSTILIFFVLSCQSKQAETKNNGGPGPYEVFYDTLAIPEITDTVLVQQQTRVFGCGTAAMAYSEQLQTSGLDKFYDRYGDVLSSSSGIKVFSRKNKTRILWITRGNEGEALALADSTLHADSAFEKRMLAQKCFIKITETPERMDKVTVYTSVAYPLSGIVFSTTHILSEKNKTWKIENISLGRTSDQASFEQAYYP